MNHETVELAFVGLAALALATQAIVMLVLFLGIRKGVQSMKEEVDEIKASMMPILRTVGPIVESTREALSRITPKVVATVDDVSEMAHLARKQAANVEASVEEIVARANKQAGRIDGMVSGTLDAVDRAGDYVAKAVSKPVRQLSGMLAGLRAMIESLSSNQAGPQPPFYENEINDDKDMFV
jgi:uncharacterized protein YoxC